VKLNAPLECKFISKNAHRTLWVRVVSRWCAVTTPCRVATQYLYGDNGERQYTTERNAIGHTHVRASSEQAWDLASTSAKSCQKGAPYLVGCGRPRCSCSVVASPMQRQSSWLAACNASVPTPRSKNGAPCLQRFDGIYSVHW
jgi:hypothetical protein